MKTLKPSYIRQNRPNRQIGLTLIEVLITIVIMAFGLLGVAQMQTVSLKSNFEASQASTASFLAEDIISRMRSTPLADLEDYDTDGSPISDTNPNPSSEQDKCTNSAPCSVANKVKRDLWEWQAFLIGTDGLVNPSGCIQVDDTKTNQIRIIVAWDGIGKAKESATSSCGTVSGDEYKRRSLTIYTVF